jgi:3-deoxy-D-manno-octulosonic-acid transferase
MVVNTMGMLSAIYRYGHIAYIGGGLGVGIHNTLEAATYGMPVVFGPKYKKFKEACDLIDCGAGFTINNEKSLRDVLDTMRSDIQRMATAQKAASGYVKSMCGATELIMKRL